MTSKLHAEVARPSGYKRLAKRDRIIFTLHDRDKLTYNAIGQRFGISAGRVRQIFNRLRTYDILAGKRDHW